VAWNKEKQQGRYEVIFRDRELHDHVEARAKRLGMSIAEYLQALSRAEMLLERGDYALVSLLGVGPLLAAAPPLRSEQEAPAPPPPEPPSQKDTRLLDAGLEQLGL
jgi:hypothetical protein